MEVENKENLISSFLEITSSTREEASYFLETHRWDLDAAVSTFLDNDASAADLPAVPNPNLPPPSIPAAENSPENQEGDTRSRQHAGNIRTFADLNPSPDEGQEYYTGGQKSGMMVQDPNKAKDVDALFEQARQSAVDRPVEPSRSASTSFTGPSRMLSGEPVPSSPQREQDQPRVVMHTITFWRNGFTVNDGPLRSFDDPENATFMASIVRSECPRELEPEDRKIRVHVNLVKRDDNYTEPTKPKTPFQGVGRTLGASGSGSAEPQAPPAQMNTAPGPSRGLIVDQAAPTTSIQLRLADGTRLVSRFNKHHTVRDVRRFIDASRPGGSREYKLLTMGFPPKQLTDFDLTIEQAGIANSVVIQKL
ncbi:Plant UBX domain-containing protein 5 [Raphanus sativus]|uniref:Plant UBX domain-containing protein 5-like n=1 Tax=Raphanus sativus TaxID=3726 RepID=A0A9W3CNU1_RAPSA|nr:plant UBX domain-containing protein 5-like [Raphanus sativus]KAJ4871851.1 Plant UBX domain-containing protein 5 [Raphanus sativus]